MSTATTAPDLNTVAVSSDTPMSEETAQGRYPELVIYEAHDAAARLNQNGQPGIQTFNHTRFSDSDLFDHYEGKIRGWSLVQATYVVGGDKKKLVTYILQEKGTLAYQVEGEPARDIPATSVPTSTLSTILYVLARLG